MVSFSSAAETENNSIASAPLINKNSEQLFLIYPYLRGSVYLQPHHWSHYLYPVHSPPEQANSNKASFRIQPTGRLSIILH